MSPEERLDLLRSQNIDPYPFFRQSSATPRGGWLRGRLQEISVDRQKGAVQTAQGITHFAWGKALPRQAQILAPGDWIELAGAVRENIFVAEQVRLLAPCLASEESDALRHSRTAHEALRKRAVLNDGVRAFFRERGFLEVETPILGKAPEREGHIDPFECIYSPEGQGAQETGYLITSPEYAMKKLLVGGCERIFQITKVFRNGEVTQQHNPEFTMLEWYRAFADADALLEDFERLLPSLAEKFHFRSPHFSFKPPYERFSVRDLFSRYAGIELLADEGAGELAEKARKAGLATVTDPSYDDTFTQILVERVEPRLPKDRPFFLVDYPRPQAALAKRKSDGFAERFEVYLGAMELANGFSELNDPQEQRLRFAQVEKLRNAQGKKTGPLDEDFLAALERGLPPSAGVAVGLDRLLMVLLQKTSIRDVLAFPW